jgi:SAM-dependent methyltransferase
MPWWFAVVESKHEFQNPTSAEKIRTLGRRLGLGPRSHVLDMASGRGGPAVLLAGEFGCKITCVERAEEFLEVAKQRARDAGLSGLIEFAHADGRSFSLQPNRYDAALCLGASFVWDGLPGTLAALQPAARPGGFVVVGEPYWRRWPLPEGFEPEEGHDFLPLAATAEQFSNAGLEFITLIASSQDDWDHYESLHWLSVEEWLHENPNDPDAPRFREMFEYFRDRYLQWERELLGWGIFVGRKR